MSRELPVKQLVHVWLALDPEERRVMVHPREWSDGDFPRGKRGVGWPRRELDVDAALLEALLRAECTPEEQDRIHRQWWDDAAMEGDPLWPEL